MRKFFITVLVIVTISKSFSQNLGIGTTTPAYPLTVVPNGNGIGIVQKSGSVEMGFVTNAATGAWLKTFTNHNLNFTVNHITNNPDPLLIVSTTGNVGISTGVTAPAYKLDINGRMRIRNNSVSNQTAGIWFDGNTLAARSLIGTINETHVGIWGSGGTGWNIAMNVENGNTGIGTSVPTAKLDINGVIRLRSNSPKKGSVLTSTDNNGNATWQAPIAFRAFGSADGNSTIYDAPNGGGYDTKYFFSTAPDYNLGLHYNANTSEFIAPVKGIYHFNGQMAFEYETNSVDANIYVANLSNNQVVDIRFFSCDASSTDGLPYDGEFHHLQAKNVVKLAADIYLEAGYKVEVRFSSSNMDPFAQGVYNSVSPDPRLTWFAGHLVTRL